jgi:hypothetical protein
MLLRNFGTRLVVKLCHIDRKRIPLTHHCGNFEAGFERITYRTEHENYFYPTKNTNMGTA